MEIDMMLSWVAVGLLAGWLVSAAHPRRSNDGLRVVGVGVICAVAGGGTWMMLVDHGVSSFLGAVITGVPGALAVSFLLGRAKRTRYRHY